MTFFRREPLVGCFVFFHFSTVVHCCYPSCSLSSIAVTPINFRSFSKSIAALDTKKTIKRGRDKLSKWLYLSRASSLPFRRTPAASHFPFQPSYSFGDTWNTVFVLESCYSTFPVVIIICLLLSFQVPWCGDPPLQTGRYYV